MTKHSKPKKARSRRMAAALAPSSPGSAKKASRPSGLQVQAEVVRLVGELGAMIETARNQVAVTANAVLTTLYWQIGYRVRTEVLQGQRAEYGAQIVAAVCTEPSKPPETVLHSAPTSRLLGRHAHPRGGRGGGSTL